jgi:capsular exopolysaccharide synthesis family protein
MIHSQLERQVQRERKSGGLSGCLVTALEPHSPASEAYRTLRTNILHSLIDGTPPRVVVVVTSPGSKESKSAVCANLGVALAQAGKNTLIVDCDLREPRMHRIFGLGGSQGIVEILKGECHLREVCQEPLPGLKVLTANTAPPNPAELLESQRLSDLLADVREEFDYVLVDSSPAGLVSDSAILATQGDGVLLVLDGRKTRKANVRRTVRNLTAVGATILGTVMNNVKKS